VAWLIRSQDLKIARYVFGYSIIYLFLLFGALVVDAGITA
jgi:heme O synthase-like polyprenyltransferase